MTIRAASLILISSLFAAVAVPGHAAARTVASSKTGYSYKVTTLSYSNEVLLSPGAINDFDEAAGQVQISGGACAFESGGHFKLYGAGSSCRMTAINSAGIAVGIAQPPNGPSEGYIYGDGFNEYVPSGSEFTDINESGLLAGALANGTPGIYVLGTNTWIPLADPKTGCTNIYLQKITDSGIALGNTSCGPPGTSFVAITKSHYRYVAPPNNLVAGPFSPTGDVALSVGKCPSPGDAYLWRRPWNGNPIDLGQLAGDPGDCYVPAAISALDEVIGFTQNGYQWVWDKNHGMRDLAKLANLQGLPNFAVTAISTHGHILGWSHSNTSSVWVILTPM